MSLPLVVPTVNACSGCGKCCRDFGSDGVSTGLSLFCDEFRTYQKLAKQRGLSFRSVPKVVGVERSTGRGVVSHYVVLSQPCVFYDVAIGCSIYLKRPLVCQAFPYSIVADNDLLVGNSTAREAFLAMASQLGEDTPGVVSARKILARRARNEEVLRGLLTEDLVSLNVTFYSGLIDLDLLL